MLVLISRNSGTTVCVVQEDAIRVVRYSRLHLHMPADFVKITLVWLHRGLG